MQENTQKKILSVGMELINQKGFNNLGLKEILSAANIPKGSFYYYFKSKEDFGLQVIRQYSAESLNLLRKYLTDKQKTSRKRLYAFFTDQVTHFQSIGFTNGCLLGNCSLELSDLKSSYAERLAIEFEAWQEIFAACIAEGQEDGSISAQTDANILAAFVFNSWEGAIVRMKATKSAEPLEVFIEMLGKVLD